ncbi:phosphatidylserine decarboxylase [Isoalcanivorax pacificus W11-5]|uniref:Phosphatidylserine decarboxylase proenzyme n=1 Tax=Isoalcanivorax pacificus W11-5 TaxID=391936 RepID=A0A0B4XSY4_9GAMM|nr:archaetidylserine decarboxylase [Isoalcanivorax pacificus]AJD49578.1 phosphatidylserine decarboxylase [Isoalcanivorax pacificus W11-5]
MQSSFVDRLFVLLQYLVPQHLLSRLVGWCARSEIPWIKTTFINQFSNRFDIDLSEAVIEDPDQFASFNAFFTRALKDGARPIAPEADDIACPADGTISQLGKLRGSDVLQAKGQYYSVYELLGGDSALASEFSNGHFATVYLSPRDYHRVHMPVTGTLREMIYVPGKLFSVNAVTTRQVPRLFARNERAVCIFDTEQGPVAVILVGAMIVAGIETVFAGQVTPQPTEITRTRYDRVEPVVIEKGAELGRFMLGSTVVMLFPEGACDWEAGLGAESPVRMGQPLGKVRI